MKEKYKLLTDGQVRDLRLHVPDTCPICHYKIDPEGHMGYFFEKDLYKQYRILYSCPQKNCLEVFIGYYSEYIPEYNNMINYNYSAPYNYNMEKFEDKIEDLSQRFVNIYNQALIAEAKKLDQICGMGYRKALEILIKDYLIYKNKGDSEKIMSNHSLGRVIDTYIEERKIKDMAKRASWLGNDHAHYTQKWETKDIKDLKILIKTTIYWIEAELEYDHYIKEME